MYFVTQITCLMTQDSPTYTTGDAGERYSRLPGWDGEADTYFSYTRRARQFVEGTKIQERYLCGPRLEAQLTGRAESAVEGCRPGWLSHVAWNIAALSLRTHIAKLALPDMGSHLQEFIYKLKRKKYEPMASWSTRYRNECVGTEVHDQGASFFSNHFWVSQR